jgi:hydrogenase nickel incorporation protein HypB
MFRAVDLVLVTKLDLQDRLPEFDVQRVLSSLHSIGCETELMGVSSRSGAGIDGWCNWLDARSAMRPSADRAAIADSRRATEPVAERGA